MSERHARGRGGETASIVRRLPPPLAVAIRREGGEHLFTLERGRCVVGASDDCDVVVRDPTVSRRHALLTLVPEGMAVEDLKSRNGTFYLGQRIERAILGLGSHLRLGSVDLHLDPALPDHAATDEHQYRGMIGQSEPMRRLFTLLQRLEGSLVSVLVQGPSGVGKELVARAIHEGSQVAEGPLVVLNCGAISQQLMQSELFGHARGAFTGASEAREGAFEAAHGGTLFLDEVGELPLDAQPALLRALEAGETKRLGENQTRHVEVRVVAATNRDLEEEVAAGRFREDLYFRLAVVRLRVPPLRERPEDIPLLASHFAEAEGGAVLPPEVVRSLADKPWRGNARELRNAVLAYLAIGVLPDARRASDLLDVALTQYVDLHEGFQQQKEALVTRFGRAYLGALLASAEGNVSEAARRAGMDRSYLRKLLQKYEVQS